jgi:type VI secretion system protein ImpC
VTPKLFGPAYEHWSDLQEEPDNFKVRDFFVGDPSLEPWRQLRTTRNASLLAFTTGHILGRTSYLDAKNFKFKEITGGKEENYVWVNSVIGLAERLAEACFQYDWPVQFRGEEGGGVVRLLPRDVIAADHIIGPMDLETPNKREETLSQLGFMPLLEKVGTSDAVVRLVQTCFEPGSYVGPDAVFASANAQLHARLPYILLACRISQYVTRMAWKKIGVPTTAEKLKGELEEWLRSEVIKDQVSPGDPMEELFKRPVFAATVEVTERPEKPGYYIIKFAITPHIQFEGARMDFSLTAAVPKRN